MSPITRLLLAVLLAVAGLAPSAPAAVADDDVTPLPRAHAHNDYEHDRPLFDALAHGFTSVEADVYLVDGALLVGHDPEDLTPDRTLRSLYLDPLWQRVREHRGSVYAADDTPLQLLVDIKNTGADTYLALHDQLRRYQRMLTTYRNGRVQSGAVAVVISGDRPRELMESQRVRYAGYDGRLSDLGQGAPASFLPLISDNWTLHFTWQGVGPMPELERAKLRRIVQTAHANGQQVRFWATPDADLPNREAVWRELLAADVDWINTDDLAGLEQFLRTHDSAAPSAAADAA